MRHSVLNRNAQSPENDWGIDSQEIAKLLNHSIGQNQPTENAGISLLPMNLLLACKKNLVEFVRNDNKWELKEKIEVEQVLVELPSPMEGVSNFVMGQKFTADQIIIERAKEEFELDREELEKLLPSPQPASTLTANHQSYEDARFEAELRGLVI